MRKLFYILSFVSLVFIISCEEEVNIKSDFQETYILNCLLNADTTYQVVYLSESFDVDGYNSSTYRGDPFIKGARITIYQEGVEYEFNENQIDSLPGFNFSHPITIYETNNYQPKHNKNVRIQAVLPNGNIIYAEQQTIRYQFTALPFFGKIIPPSNPNEQLIEFRTLHNYDKFYFVPKLRVVYEYALNPGKKNYVEIPFDYMESPSGLKPVYPGIMKEISFNYERDVLELTMRNISADEPMKSRYTFNRPLMSLLILNDDLAAFYSSENYVNDNYSIVVSAPEYTNIVGGKGIFGSYGTVTGKLSMYSPFVNELGYNYNGME